MDRFSRVVLGYHGCEPAFAEALIRGEMPISEWKPSHNVYDWLGEGIYFWEFGPRRALEWDAKKGVVGAVIQLGICLDLTDLQATEMLRVEYDAVRKAREEIGLAMLENKGKRRDLDCLIVNSLVDSIKTNKNLEVETVRGAFLEGDPAFPGSGILRESHIQVAVRNTNSILGVFRPNL